MVATLIATSVTRDKRILSRPSQSYRRFASSSETYSSRTSPFLSVTLILVLTITYSFRVFRSLTPSSGALGASPSDVRVKGRQSGGQSGQMIIAIRLGQV